MQFVITQEQLPALEAAAQTADAGLEAWPARLALAWHLRQRDPARSRAWVTQLRALDWGRHQQIGWSPLLVEARLLLIEAEQALLEARLEVAAEAIARARALLEPGGDETGLADAALLSASHAYLIGRGEASTQWLVQAAIHADAAGDPLRVQIARTREALGITFRDPIEGRRRFGAAYAQLPSQLPAEAAWTHEMQGTLAAQASDYGPAAVARMHAFDAALQTGQIDRAIVSAQNAADALNSLNEHEMALEWLDKAAQLVRPTGWPLFNGLVMGQLAETLRRLGQLDEAHDVVHEVMPTIAHLRGSRIYCIVTRSLAELCRERGEGLRALEAFAELEYCSREQGHPDLLVYACRGQAQVLMQQGRPSEAEHKAQQGLQVAIEKRHVYRQIDCLQVLADLHAQCPLPPPPGMQSASAELHYLEQAHSLAGTIEGFRLPAELLERMADAHARLGQHEQAYGFVKEALQARQVIQSETVQKRMAAMRVMHQTERARVEAEHMRQLADEQMQRAESMGQSRDTLLQLSELGRALTALLDRQSILGTLAADMHALLEFESLCLAQPQADAAEWGNGTGKLMQLLPDGSVHALAWPPADPALAWLLSAPAAELARLSPDEQGRNICLVLGAGARPMGVLFGTLLHQPTERDQLVLRNLAAYAAIALENAQAHQRLHDTRAQLVQQEKLAALGSLVAGVAHELNTPLGNCLMTASSLQHETRALRVQLDAQSLRRSALLAYANTAETATDLLMRGLTRASDLVQRFRQIAAEPLHEQVRRCDVASVLADCARAQSEALDQAGAVLTLDAPPGLQLQTHPAHLQQVLEQLLQNALLHGAAGRAGVQIRLGARPHPGGGVIVSVADDGPGVAAELRARIFDPFFSTRFGQGGSGLGLYIAQNLAQRALLGELRLVDGPGPGACFELQLPQLPLQGPG